MVDEFFRLIDGLFSRLVRAIEHIMALPDPLPAIVIALLFAPLLAVLALSLWGAYRRVDMALREQRERHAIYDEWLALMHQGQQDVTRMSLVISRTQARLMGQPADESLPSEVVEQLYEARSRETGFVYLIKGGDGTYKIGIARDPKNRLQRLQTSASVKLELVATMPTQAMHRTESALHAQYADKRKHGEWFALTDADVAEIRAMFGDTNGGSK